MKEYYDNNRKERVGKERKQKERKKLEKRGNACKSKIEQKLNIDERKGGKCRK